MGTGRGGFPPFFAPPHTPAGWGNWTHELLILREPRALQVRAGREYVQREGVGLQGAAGFVEEISLHL